jgi:hypothetical protein
LLLPYPCQTWVTLDISLVLLLQGNTQHIKIQFKATKKIITILYNMLIHKRETVREVICWTSSLKLMMIQLINILQYTANIEQQCHSKNFIKKL